MTALHAIAYSFIAVLVIGFFVIREMVGYYRDRYRVTSTHSVADMALIVFTVVAEGISIFGVCKLLYALHLAP